MAEAGGSAVGVGVGSGTRGVGVARGTAAGAASGFRTGSETEGATGRETGGATPAGRWRPGRPQARDQQPTRDCQHDEPDDSSGRDPGKAPPSHRVRPGRHDRPPSPCRRRAPAAPRALAATRRPKASPRSPPRERGREGPGRGPAIRARFREAAAQHGRDGRGDFGRGRLGHRLLHVLHQDRDRRRPGVGDAPRQAFEGHDPERVHVGEPVDLLPHRLLGGHVARRALDHAGRRGDRRPLEHARDAEVGEVPAARLVEQDVRGFHVAMHDTSLVGVVQRPRHVRKQGGHLARRERTAAHPIGERPARHQPHRHPGRALLDPESVHRNDVGMLEPAGHARLLAEALGERGVVEELGRQDLERDVALERRVAGPVDGRHPAAAEGTEDAVGTKRRPDGKLQALRLQREAAG